MAITYIIALLAAYSSLILAGPVPRHDRRQAFVSYANSSSIRSSTLDNLPTSNAIVDSLSTLAAGSDLLAIPETALIVQPIQQSVFTSVLPAITFQNPDGEDIATGDPETILSTAFITPTPTPAPQQSSSASPSPTPSSSLEAKPAESNTLIASSTIISADLRTSIAAVENTTASETSKQVPQFTYSPEEDNSLVSASPTAIPTSETLILSSGGLPGFNHPGSKSLGPTASAGISSVAPTSNSSSSQSTVQTPAPTIIPSSIAVPISTANSSVSLNPSAPSASESGVEDITSKVYVTETQYTTVFPSVSPTGFESSSQTPLATAAPTEGQNNLPVEQSSSKAVFASSNRSTAAPILSTALPPPPPPVVIITQFTTVTPNPDSEPTRAPEASSALPLPEPGPSPAPISSATPEPSTSLAVEPVPSSSSVVAEPPSVPPSQAPESPPMPSVSESTSSPPAVTESSTSPPEASASPTQDVPEPTEAPPAPSPEPIPTSTSEGPLIITPIPPSQIFTVTVTATDTIRETTTVTVTA
ncbi:hypothetical protein J1614_011304 [Plenodomus biglobosus]|nr:hypothetical protein J1614_011304 [Plenodomus biglobosus]